MALVEMLVALIIVMLLVYMYMKLVWKDAGGASRQTKKALAKQGIKANNPQSMVQSAQEKVDQFNKKTEASQHEYENIK